MLRSTFEVRTSDGRRLSAEGAGPEDGDVALMHSGPPGTRHLYEGQLEDGAERGLRHVCYSRPGYAGSDRQAGRSIADCAKDTAAVVDALGVESFYVAGHSGGGAHALACAALLPQQVLSVACLSSFAPRGAEGLDLFRGM